MDISKLPKLSQTPAPPENAQGPTSDTPTTAKVELYCKCGAPITPGTNFCSHCGANYYEAVGSRAVRSEGVPAGGMWIEAFLSIGVGVFLMMMVPGALKYFGHHWFNWHTGPFVDPLTSQPCDYLLYEDGSKKFYRDLPNYLSDLAVTLFALALVLEGIVLAVVRNRWIVLATAIITAGVTLLNLWYVVSTYSSMGFAPISTLAVIFGVVMTGYQMHLFRELSRGVARGRR